MWLLPAVDSILVILVQDPVSPPLCDADLCSAEQLPQLNQPSPLLSYSNSIVNLFQTLSVLLGGSSWAELLWQLENSNDAKRNRKLSLPSILFVCHVMSKKQKSDVAEIRNKNNCMQGTDYELGPHLLSEGFTEQHC